MTNEVMGESGFKTLYGYYGVPEPTFKRASEGSGTLGLQQQLYNTEHGLNQAKIDAYNKAIADYRAGNQLRQKQGNRPVGQATKQLWGDAAIKQDPVRTLAQDQLLKQQAAERSKQTNMQEAYYRSPEYAAKIEAQNKAAEAKYDQIHGTPPKRKTNWLEFLSKIGK